MSARLPPPHRQATSCAPRQATTLAQQLEVRVAELQGQPDPIRGRQPCELLSRLQARRVED